MPTITTTITSAEATGAVTTVTTTEATPEAASTTSPASELFAAQIAEWGAGTLNANKAKFFTPDCKIDGGSRKIRAWGDSSFGVDCSKLGEWLDALATYEFNGMTWEFSAIPGGAVGHWTMTSLVHKASGRKTGAISGVNTQMFNGSVFTTLRIESSHMAQLDELFADDVLTLEAGVGAWAEGKLAADKAKFFAPGCTILAGPGNVSGFKTYTYDTIGAWETELAAYDFKDMTWSFYQAPGGAIGEWTVSSLVHKATGRATGPIKCANRCQYNDQNRITHMQLLMSNQHEVERVFAGL